MPIGSFADFIAAVANCNVGAWKLAPAATEIEAQTIRWIAEFIGYPDDSGGLLVSGGNMANLVGLLAARAAASAGAGIRKGGVRSAAKPPLLLLFGGDPYVDSEGRGHLGAGDGLHPLDSL